MDSKNPELIFVDALINTSSSFKETYDPVLESNSFFGDWVHHPPYSEQEYEDYTRLLKENKEFPQDLKDLEKLTLIGANKVFGILEGVFQNVLISMHSEEVRYQKRSPGFLRKIQQNIDLRLSNNTSLRVNSPEDLDHFSYKNLYLKIENQGTLFLRAVDTSSFEGFYIPCRGRGRIIPAMRGRFFEVLGEFKKLHEDVQQGRFKFHIDVPLDLKFS